MSDAGMSWTEERVELLSKLWAEGLSASQIATALGGGVTRNAVIGKVHRLGLSGRSKTPSATPQQRPAREKLPGAQPDMGASADPEAAPRPVLPRPVASAAVAIPESQRVSILELRDTMCRWPLGDPAKADFAFCGARAAPGVPYCASHCQIAYQPAAERKRIRV